MLFKSLVAALGIPFVFGAGSQSASIGSIVVTPIDYAAYSDTIDLQLVRYSENGESFFYDNTVKTFSNETKTISNALITADGLLQIDASDDQYFLNVDPVSGRVSITTNNSTANGQFSISNGILYFSYHSTFIACKEGTDSSNSKYSLTWRSASSVAICQNDWLLVQLKTYSSSSNVVSQFFPDGYQTSIAATATENLNSATQVASATSVMGSSSSSSNAAAMGLTVGGGALLAMFAYLL